MDTEIQNEVIRFEIKVKGRNGQEIIAPVTKRRSLLGRGQACDIVLPFSDISSIHAVLEVSKKNEIKIYDLNSKNGTIVSGNRVVVESISLDQEIFLGDNRMIVTDFKKSDLPPPPLAILEEVQLPQKPESVIAERETAVPYVRYPLAKDKNAEFSEYIFEDADELYPIFKYDMGKSSVEVIIVFNDRVQSVDYIPSIDGTYSLVGKRPKENQISYPYLGKDEVVPLINVKNGEAEIFPIPGYEATSLGDKKRDNLSQAFFINDDEIVQFQKQHIQIFIRKTGAPPKVAAAPVLRRDPELKKYMLLMIFLVSSFLIPFTLFEVDEEIEKEKAPERIATILYKRKLTVSPTPAIDKTKKAPKVTQKSPKQEKPKKPKQPKQQIAKKPNKPKQTPNKGVKNAAKTGKVKRAQPNKGPRNVVKDRVTPTKPKTAKAAKGSGKPRKASAAVTNSKGAVDTYRSADFKSTVSSLISKGGSTKSARVRADGTAGYQGSSVAQADTGATMQRATVNNNVGSVSGVTDGKLDSSKGVEGLVNKKNIYTAGLPYKTVILGGLDPDIIRRILVENIPRFRYCYQKELDAAKAAFNGVVKLNFIIGASGHVTKAGVEGSSGLPPSVRSCVVNVLRRITFPEPMGGGVVEVGQPMNFYPKVK